MKKEQLLDMIGEAPERDVLDAGQYKRRRLPRMAKWLGGIAAALAVVLLVQSPGMPLMLLAYEGDWAHVLLAGAPVGGWMKTDAMLIGSHQMEAEYLAPDDCPAINLLKNQLDVYLLPLDDLTTSPLLHHHDNHRAFLPYRF